MKAGVYLTVNMSLCACIVAYIHVRGTYIHDMSITWICSTISNHSLETNGWNKCKNHFIKRRVM